MREQHPMRYNRMTEILKVVASVKLSNTFLLKSYFLKVTSSLTHYPWYNCYSETTANVNCNLLVQYNSCWLCCFCSWTIIWNMYGIRRPVHLISFEIILFADPSLQLDSQKWSFQNIQRADLRFLRYLEFSLSCSI